jgi:hypothetical protein
MPTHERRNLTPPAAVNALRWIAVGELGQWLLSVRNGVSRRNWERISHGRRIDLSRGTPFAAV